MRQEWCCSEQEHIQRKRIRLHCLADHIETHKQVNRKGDAEADKEGDTEADKEGDAEAHKEGDTEADAKTYEQIRNPVV